MLSLVFGRDMATLGRFERSLRDARADGEEADRLAA
jgi:hypothetical protein